MLRVGLELHVTSAINLFLFYLDSETVPLTLSNSNCRVWHDTAIPFKQVVEEFESWLAEHDLWGKETDGTLNDAAFVTW